MGSTPAARSVCRRAGAVEAPGRPHHRQIADLGAQQFEQAGLLVLGHFVRMLWRDGAIERIEELWVDPNGRVVETELPEVLTLA